MDTDTLSKIESRAHSSRGVKRTQIPGHMSYAVMRKNGKVSMAGHRDSVMVTQIEW